MKIVAQRSQSYSDFFRECTGFEPYRYQVRFAEALVLPDTLELPTGLGKTLTYTLAWLWRRRYSPQSLRNVPRRLVICLPLRSLVEQQYQVIDQIASRFGVPVHVLMGGAIANSWDREVASEQILIGTQDQLLSRALHRGYAMNPHRWTMHFSLLNNDVLWVLDEIQLMGVGVLTSLQLQHFRNEMELFGISHTLWCSATIAPNVLQTADYQPTLNQFGLVNGDCQDERVGKLVRAAKPIKQFEKKKPADVAKFVLQEYDRGLAIIRCNTVGRAQNIYQALQGKIPCRLVHGRFRPHERAQLLDDIQSYEGVLVATQCLEAGVDVSARLLITDLAAWSSMVQIFGRAGRRGEDCRVFWVDVADKDAAPYTADDLKASREILKTLSDCGIAALQEVPLPDQKIQGQLLTQRAFDSLFDTSPTLEGMHEDVSPYIRDTGASIFVAWRNQFAGGEIRREELCSVPLTKDTRAFLAKARARIWDRKAQEWVKTTVFYPGQMVLLLCSEGGYDPNLGFTGEPSDKPTEVPGEEIPLDTEDSDWLAEGCQFAVTQTQHAGDAAQEGKAICTALNYPDLPDSLLVRACRWHDAGKAHSVQQNAFLAKHPELDAKQLWAKTPYKRGDRLRYERKGFRHEFASALLALQSGEPFLLAYLVAAHHGRVRLSLPHFYGCEASDVVPAQDLGADVQIEETLLSLPESLDWEDQVYQLLDEQGAFRLAFLETVIRAADWKASALGGAFDV